MDGCRLEHTSAGEGEGEEDEELWVDGEWLLVSTEASDGAGATGVGDECVCVYSLKQSDRYPHHLSKGP